MSGQDAFFLHDTLGFPVEVTAEIAADRGRSVDMAGFKERLEEQRTRAALRVARAPSQESGLGGET